MLDGGREEHVGSARTNDEGAARPLFYFILAMNQTGAVVTS